MKTAEQWWNEQSIDSSGKRFVPFLSRELIKQIQLDAMKEGMRRAAGIVDDTDVVDVSSYYAQLGDAWETKNNARKSILTAAEQLTEKDL